MFDKVLDADVIAEDHGGRSSRDVPRPLVVGKRITDRASTAAAANCGEEVRREGADGSVWEPS